MIAREIFLNTRRWIADVRRPLLLAHRRPDGDALGALVAMDRVLREAGSDPLPTLFEPPPPRYAVLSELVRWRRWDTERAVLASACDAVVIFDTCAWAQLDPVADWLPGAPRTLVVDHHPTHDPVATRDGDLRMLDPSAAAVCLILAEWMQANGLPIGPAVATALFAGLGTDTGWFRYANTDARALGVAAELAEAGARPNDLFRALYQQDPVEKLRLIARLLDSLELHAAGQIALLKLRQADFRAAGADEGMTEDIINEATRLASTDLTILLTEQPDGEVRVNLRSKAQVDVAALAKQFGGGGHVRAAGARVAGRWDEVVARVLGAGIDAVRGCSR
jgi:phosphoesterase RecJ-like protein